MKKIVASLSLFIMAISAYAQFTQSEVINIFKKYQTQYGLMQADIESLVITDQYADSKTGITHIYVRQAVNGIEIFNANSSVHIDKNGNVLTLNNGFVGNAKQKINATQVSIGTTAALSIAGAEAEMNISQALSKTDAPLVNNMLVINDKTVSAEPIKTKLYYVLDNNTLKIAYNVELFNNETNDWWNIRVDATNGTVIEKNNWTVHCQFDLNNKIDNFFTQPTQNSFLSADNNSYNKSSVDGKYLVVPFPYESPNHKAREFVSGSVAKTNASPYGWHDTNGADGAEFTVTRGNNVNADEDTLNNNGVGYSPDGGDSLVFNFPIDTNWLDYRYYLPAAITNLFYANNFVHDVLYQYGFDEVSGNFQSNNYGKGGAQNDQVEAEAQDGSGTSNANFSTPSDGGSGRMQMFLWPTAAVSAPPLTLNAPAYVVGNYTAPLSSFGPSRFGNINAQVVLVDDATSSDSLGCNTLINAADLNGKIALIYRGTCGLTSKVQNAQNAGAVAVIMINNSTATPVAMGGTSNTISIPSVIISQSNGAKIRAAIDNGDTVMATLKGVPVTKAFDSDFDNGVMAHEFGHGVSNRLTGGPSNSSCLYNGEQAGEGWSDFFALAFTAKVGDKGTDGRAIGTFVFNQNPNQLGIRNYKYSTNKTINPMTYNFMKNQNGEVHYTGTIWCTMLWDMYWGMTDKYGFDADIYNGTGGNNKAIQLVIDGLKLQPCSPGFADARDAILKADSINNGFANKDVIWSAFARRGLGYSASQGSSSSTKDGTTAFDLPPGVTGVEVAANLARYIEVSPNPTQDKVIIVIPDQLKQVQVLLTDITGKTIINKQMNTDDLQHISIDLGNEMNGLYFIKITNGGTVFQSKIMLNK